MGQILEALRELVRAAIAAQISSELLETNDAKLGP
jgi:hypothetical protein